MYAVYTILVVSDNNRHGVPQGVITTLFFTLLITLLVVQLELVFGRRSRQAIIATAVFVFIVIGFVLLFFNTGTRSW